MTTKTGVCLSPLLAIVLGGVISLTGCEQPGPAENAGKEIDKGTQKVKDTISPPGPMEKVGREVDKATDK